LLFLLLQLLLLPLLRLLRSLLLASLDVGFVLRRLGLFVSETLGTLRARLSILRRLLSRRIELALIISLLSIIRRLVRSPLRRFGAAPCRVKLVLTLFLIERLGIARLGRGALRRFDLLVRLFERLALVALLSATSAPFLVELELLGMNLRLNLAHLVACTTDAGIHEEPVITVVHGNAVLVLVLGTARIERLLTRVEVGRRRRGARPSRRVCAPRRSGWGIRVGSGWQALCRDGKRHCNERGTEHRSGEESGKTGDRQRRRRASEHG
jgi:hypothetical protein